jgi:octanoyl-[GcvH]:protein N-octanoyltransferase
VQLVTAAHPAEPALDMAVSHAVLRRVAAGALPETARVFRPGPTLAFGRLDALGDGYAEACRAARARGFTPVVRLGGGRAAAYDEGSVVVELVTRTAAVTHGVQERFAVGTQLLLAALARVGVAAEVGELPGEYCPGRWSVHAPGGPKLAGAAQRSIKGASLFTAVVVVEGGARVRAVLEAVHAELGLAWEPTTAGAAEDGRPGLTGAAFAAAVVAELGGSTPGALDAPTLALARELLGAHAVPSAHALPPLDG